MRPSAETGRVARSRRAALTQALFYSDISAETNRKCTFAVLFPIFGQLWANGWQLFLFIFYASSMRHRYRFGALLALTLGLGAARPVQAQDTRILGFADVTSTYVPKTGKVSFGLGEQDLFITSDISDRISFLGETVFKYDATAGTKFAVSVERIILKYNIKGNHNFLVGKVHTPVNYWNDTYHHGRVFFPTIYRPAIFTENLLPVHTLGAWLQGQNLGNIRFGYDLLVGNGIGSPDATDNDMRKSVTAAVHIKPLDGMRIGASSYTDRVSAGATGYHNHGGTPSTAAPLVRPLTQQMFTGSVAYFRSNYELLAESSHITNRTDTTGAQSAQTLATYVYVGVRPLPTWVPKLVIYGRYDNVTHQHSHAEALFRADDLQSFVGGLRYEFNYLAVTKLEFQRDMRRPLSGPHVNTNAITAQFAVGF